MDKDIMHADCSSVEVHDVYEQKYLRAKRLMLVYRETTTELCPDVSSQWGKY